tara:strand:+ start:38 stop:373 length:336 start_codon:yes stop_codon:yes gene_type:complete
MIHLMTFVRRVMVWVVSNVILLLLRWLLLRWRMTGPEMSERMEPLRRPRVGEMIVYTLFSGNVRACRVTAVHDDVKNGYPGFDGITSGGMSCWGYDDQATAYPVIKEVDIG